jgi:hypothetical protein
VARDGCICLIDWTKVAYHFADDWTKFETEDEQKTSKRANSRAAGMPDLTWRSGEKIPSHGGVCRVERYVCFQSFLVNRRTG